MRGYTQAELDLLRSNERRAAFNAETRRRYRIAWERAEAERAERARQALAYASAATPPSSVSASDALSLTKPVQPATPSKLACFEIWLSDLPDDWADRVEKAADAALDSRAGKIGMLLTGLLTAAAGLWAGAPQVGIAGAALLFVFAFLCGAMLLPALALIARGCGWIAGWTIKAGIVLVPFGLVIGAAAALFGLAG